MLKSVVNPKERDQLNTTVTDDNLMTSIMDSLYNDQTFTNTTSLTTKTSSNADLKTKVNLNIDYIASPRIALGNNLDHHNSIMYNASRLQVFIQWHKRSRLQLIRQIKVCTFDH